MNTKEIKQDKWIWFLIPVMLILLTLFTFIGKAPQSTALASNNPDPVVRFAVIGDFGEDNSDVIGVATLVASWNPDFVITTGDNNYPDGEAATIDDHIGQHYSQFIGNYQGSYGPGSITNRFWPTLGNHDWHSISCSGTSCTGAYFDYFTLPNNERYYEVDLGLVHLFSIDSDRDEPDGRDSDSIQANWLQNELAASSSCYNMVFFHHPPYSSGRHGSNSTMQWPFAAWGADALFGGHDHMYERLEVDGLPYFVNGAGGVTLYDFENLDDLPSEATSVVRYNEDHGAMLVTATATEINYQFYNKAGTLIDDYTVEKNCVDVDTLTFTPTADAYVRETAPNTNYGTATKLEIDESPDEESYLRFNVSGVTGTVESATLRLYATNSSWNGPSLYATDSSWSETEISWNNRPSTTSGVIADVGEMSSGTWVEFDVTTYVSGNGSYDFVLLPDSQDGVTFSARESNAPAELVLKYTSPSTATPTATPSNTATPTPTASATVPTPMPTTLSFAPSADVYVRESAPNSNYSASTKLKIDKSPDEESYIRFSVSGVTGPVQNAILRMYATNSSVDGPAIYATDNNWSEAELTWNNRPSTTSGAIADVGEMSSGTWVEYDVTSYVNDNGIYNFVFLPDSRDGATFSARESNAPAELVLTFVNGSTATPTATSTPTPTATPVFLPIVLTFAPAIDAHVSEAAPATNYGTVNKLEMDKSPDEESYVRFIVNGVTGTIQNAILRMYSTNSSTNGPAVYGTDSDWSETEINWNNRPLPTTGVIDDIGAMGSYTWIEYDVTTHITGDGTYNFVFIPDSTDGVTFFSREGNNPAELVLTFMSE